MPVTVIKIPIKDATVDSGAPNTNYGGSFVLFTGRYLGAIYRSLLQFDLSTLPSGYTIVKAEMVLYIFRNNYPAVTKLFNVYRIRQNFEENTVTYNNQPSIDSLPYASLVVDNEVNTYLRVDITDLMEKWYSGQYQNYGLLIKASNEAMGSLVAFYSKDFSDERYYPYLEVSLEESIQISGRQFTSSTITGLTTGDLYSYTQAYDVSQTINYTFFVKNTGVFNSCDAKLQISPDSINWLDDSSLYNIMPGQMISIIPKIFSQYVRLAYKSTIPGSSTTIDVYIQSQV